jgi:quercetin dioxygenase-like cupin family protein
MPYVGPGEAIDRPSVDLEALADEMGPPPWRVVLAGTDALRVVLLHWPPGYATPPHVHPGAEETFLIVRGRAVFRIADGPEQEVGRGAFLVAGRGVRHAIRVPVDGPLTMLASVAPNEDRPDEAVE